MADYIAFVNSTSDCQIVRSLYSDGAAYRVGLLSANKTCTNLPPTTRLWIDAAVDGLHNWSEFSRTDYKGNPAYKQLISRITGHAEVGDPVRYVRPNKDAVLTFVSEILDRAIAVAPRSEWLSVPQLPYVDGNDRNKINRALAEASAAWRAKGTRRVKLVLPVILTNQRQLNKKTDRNKKVELASSCFEASGANAVWVVDSSLDDQDGTSNFEHIRFPGVISFQEELNARIPSDAIKIAGPYWALNVVLWCRGLVGHPAVGLGNGYQYHVPGGRVMQGDTRIALPPLRRTAVWSSQLKEWLEESLGVIPKNDPAHSEFSLLDRQFSHFRDQADGKSQTARFYLDWLKKFQAMAPATRALALYQDLSSAYVLGKGLPDLPAAEKSARNAAKVARQFMMTCL